MSQLRLRPLASGDQDEFLVAHRLMLDEDFCFGLELEPDMSWDGYLRRLEMVRLGVDLADGRVPMTFLVAADGGLVRRYWIG